MKLPQQQRSEETRGRILQAARVCFSRSGYEGTGVAEICERAGVSKGAFYHHFPSKQAVFVALLNEWLAGLDERFAVVRREASNIPQALLAMARAAQPIFADSRDQLPMFLEFWVQTSRDPAIWEKTSEPYHHYQTYFTELIQAGIAEGSLRAVDSQTTARVLMGLAVGLLAQAVANPEETDWGQALVSGIETLLSGIQAG